MILFRSNISIIMKIKHERFPPKIVNYRDYKKIDTKGFKDRFELTLKNSISFEELEETFIDLLNNFVPFKCKYLRANHSKFMTNELSKAIMLRTRCRHQILKKKTPEAKTKYNVDVDISFWKMKTPEAKAKYNKQRNSCVS